MTSPTRSSAICSPPSNAIKYSPAGGDVRVALLQEEYSVVCHVKDTGMGMDQQDQASAFTRYFRAGNVRNTAIHGVGLGLFHLRGNRRCPRRDHWP